jgi:hypothetical protein
MSPVYAALHAFRPFNPAKWFPTSRESRQVAIAYVQLNFLNAKLPLAFKRRAKKLSKKHVTY